MDRSLPDSVLLLLERHGVSAPDDLRVALEDLLSVSGSGSSEPPGLQTWAEPLAPLAAGPNLVLPERYRAIGTLGVGGMGQVLSVSDRSLGRSVAMKVAHRELSHAGRTRFLAEAQVVAQLQHPGIVAIYDFGTLPSGEPYFTMPILRGRTLTELIREVHGAVGPDGWAPGPQGTTFHRLITSFHAVADAIAYAHGRGVIHRDLKPDNVIVADHGVTVVLDWGLAKVLGSPDEPLFTTRTDGAAPTTLVGAVIGTLGYMPPEQARGQLHLLDARADVHALGATLYEILCGSPPFGGPDSLDGWSSALEGAVPPILSPAPVPADLAALARQCLARKRDERPADAAHVARVVEAWLEGANRRSRALAEVDRADAMLPEIATLRATARALAEDAETRLTAVAAHEPEAAKREAWRMQDQAEAAEAEADLREVQRIELLRGALRIDPDLREAHARLADHLQAQHAAAEQRGEVARANELLHVLRTHDTTGAHAAYLEGMGTVSLWTDPPGAEVVAHRYEVRDRRLVAVPWKSLGTTPLRELRLPMGSYRLDLALPGYAPTSYPALIERNTHWSGRLSPDLEPTPIRLPREGELGPADRYVPASCARTGGDSLAEWPRPRADVWLDGFVIREDPVTNREFIEFLDALVADGRADEAERYAPRFQGHPVYGRDREGRFVLRRDAEGDEWLPTYPVLLVDWFGAVAYAAWVAKRTGLPWRLPHELEREKAARGVDGRLYPWGNTFDPSWTWVRLSQAAATGPRAVDAPTGDVSPYGVRGLAGNVGDWCLDPFRPQAPVVGPPQLDDARVHRAFRGGNWGSGVRWCRSASRGVASPTMQEATLSFRLVRSLA